MFMPLTKQKNAPGRISTTADCWSADTTKVGFLGMTAHWIQVTDDGKWKMRSEVVALKALSGNHGGENLGRYFIGLCERVGIVSKSGSKVRSQASGFNQQTNSTFTCPALRCHVGQHFIKQHALSNNRTSAYQTWAYLEC